MNFINVAGQMRASEEWRGNRSTTVYDTKGGTKKVSGRSGLFY
jgi:hypothetical protein